MKLYVKSQHRKKPREPILNFLERYFKGLTKKTYHDEQCTQLQCSTGSSRSIDEMLIIVKTEYPKSKNSDIYKAFKKFLLSEEEKKNIEHQTLIFCKYIQKWVFYKYHPNCNIRFIWNYSDSVQKRNVKGVGTETFNSFMIDKLGFTEEELQKTV